MFTDVKKKKQLLIVLAIMIAGIVTLYFAALDPSFRFRPFDSVEWRNGNARSRGEMIEDLIDNRRLDGKSKEEITALLGEGTEKDNTVNYTVDLGVRFGFKPSLFEFAVYFDDNGRVKGYNIIEQKRPSGTDSQESSTVQNR